MCVCGACVGEGVHEYMCARIYANIHVSMNACMCVDVCAYVHTCIRTHACVGIGMCVFICIWQSKG